MMKPILRGTVFFLFMIVVSLTVSIATAADDVIFDGGDGTEAFPYLISTAEQLSQIGNYPNCYYLQTADIEMPSRYSYSTVRVFSGGYDGGGHTITGLGSCLFEENTGFVRNLGLVKAEIENSTSKSEGNFKRMTYAAAIAITNSGTISGCYSVDGVVTANTAFSATDATAQSYAGGLVEMNTPSGVIENCYVRGTVRASASARATGSINTDARADAYAGGIAAQSSGVIRNCYSTADVEATTYRSGYTGSENKYAGIICGSNLETIENSYYTEGLHCSFGVGYTTGDQPEKVEVRELQSYSMIGKLDPNRRYIWQMDINDYNEGYPMLNTQLDKTMDIILSHQPGNHGEAFELEIQPGFELYTLYYCVVGKTSGFAQYTEPLAITDQDTMVIVYLENRASLGMRKAYKLDYHLANNPVLASVASGTYHTILSVELASDEPGAEIYYTTDGSDPRQSGSTRYIGAIPLYKNTTITAVAKVNGEFGDLLQYEYRISPVITPSVPAGSYDTPFQLSLTSSLKPYEIYYTTNGWSDPTKEDQYTEKYSGAFEVYDTILIRAAACYEGEWSEIQEFRYDFPWAEITPSVPAGAYDDVIKDLDFSCNIPYLDLYVRIRGEWWNTPTPLDIYKTATVDVTARYNDRYVSSESFTYTLPDTEITSNYPSGSYNNIVNIELGCNIPSYDLYYTTNGKDPAVNGVLYYQPIALDDTTNLRVAAKYGDVVVAQESFSYTLNLVYVTADIPSGPYAGNIAVSLTPSNPFYEDIYYTTDGSDPKINGIKYVGPIAIAQSTVLKAVPALDKAFGKTSTFQYTIGSENPNPIDGIVAENFMIQKIKDGYYTVSFDVSSALPNPKSADIYIALYDSAGVLMEVKRYRDEFAVGLKNTMYYPYTANCQLPSGCYFKIMCLERNTMCPIFENGTVTAANIK